ncbi:MAG: hypothetical protein HY458_01860 [Parcubacteria group bacterium]|nr:hypothetical protein [Parcubacteria group bacterium]
MPKLSMEQVVWIELIAIWAVIGLLVGIMLWERLREFIRKMFRSPISSATLRGKRKTLRGRPAYEGKSKSVPQ